MATFVLIAIGGHTTTAGAGMAFPDWPLSAGSINPAGWWNDFFQRLEHGHRLAAETVGLLVGILCAWVWRAKWALPCAIVVSLILALGAMLLGAPKQTIAHVGLWSSAITFALMIVAGSRSSAEKSDGTSLPRTEAQPDGVSSFILHPSSFPPDGTSLPRPVRWLAFAAFLGVCAQAVLGGLRVTIESAGDPVLASAFRIMHGCFAQLELCLLVAVAALLSPAWTQIRLMPNAKKIARLGWLTLAFVYLQLIVGASMRHLGAGLAIPTFPAATPEGGWFPSAHNIFVDLNFSHTRIGAFLVTAMVLYFAIRTIRAAAGQVHLTRPSWLLIGLLLGQVTLGMFVIWNLRPPVITTLHVINGAALLATAVLLTVRLSLGPQEVVT